MNNFVYVILISNFLFLALNFFFNKNNWILQIFFLNNTYVVYAHNLLTEYNNFSLFIFILLIIIYLIEVITILLFFFNNKKNM